MSEPKKPSVLFLCVSNSCRSQLAEALLRKHAGDQFEVESAGLEPGDIHPLARAVMAEVGLDLSSHRPKNVREFLGKRHFGYLIILCAEAEARCPVFPNISFRLDWPFPDPAKAPGSQEERLSAFRQVRDAIEQRLLAWLRERRAILGERAEPGPATGSR
ncbi:MAG TPA: arsenate reductase ArsC [Planctomycetota bacterium]|nr:arsenate reductase ArsC [Planctomycetota bacterium]HRR83314.1 arsenate reductase ArsC [Planctomycetota bacterium]HRT97766.1 arsenate reductase ArsC [Planctomycetota bacterium]